MILAVFAAHHHADAGHRHDALPVRADVRPLHARHRDLPLLPRRRSKRTRRPRRPRKSRYSGLAIAFDDCRLRNRQSHLQSKMIRSCEPERLPRRRRPRQPGAAHGPRRRGARPRRPRPLRPARSRAAARPRPADRRKVCVRDLPGQHPDKYPHIHKLLIETAKRGQDRRAAEGRRPAHLRPRRRGGRGALRPPGVAYEIVPGVTAALAAGAYLEIPLTHRQLRQRRRARHGPRAAEQARQPARLEGARRVPRHARDLHGHRPAAGDRRASCSSTGSRRTRPPRSSSARRRRAAVGVSRRSPTWKKPAGTRGSKRRA